MKDTQSYGKKFIIRSLSLAGPEILIDFNRSISRPPTVESTTVFSSFNFLQISLANFFCLISISTITQRQRRFRVPSRKIATPLENLTGDAAAQLYVTKFSTSIRLNFTSYTVELCNSVISHIQRNPPKKNSYSAGRRQGTD